MKRYLILAITLMILTGCEVNQLTDSQVNSVKELCAKQDKTLIIKNTQTKSEAFCRL